MLRSAEKSVFHSELGFEVKHFDDNLVKLRIFAKKRDFVVSNIEAKMKIKFGCYRSFCLQKRKERSPCLTQYFTSAYIHFTTDGKI